MLSSPRRADAEGSSLGQKTTASSSPGRAGACVSRPTVRAVNPSCTEPKGYPAQFQRNCVNASRRRGEDGNWKWTYLCPSKGGHFLHHPFPSSFLPAAPPSLCSVDPRPPVCLCNPSIAWRGGRCLARLCVVGCAQPWCVNPSAEAELYACGARAAARRVVMAAACDHAWRVTRGAEVVSRTSEVKAAARGVVSRAPENDVVL